MHVHVCTSAFERYPASKELKLGCLTFDSTNCIIFAGVQTDGKYSLPTKHNLIWRVMSRVVLGSIVGIDTHVKKLVPLLLLVTDVLDQHV